MALHPDFISKGLRIPLVLDDEWHELLPPVRPAQGTYILLTSLLGEIDPLNEPDRNLLVKTMRYKPNASGVLVPDLVDNGTAWDTATLKDLPSLTWAHTWPSKAVVSSTYPGYSTWYRGQGGTAWLEQRLMKFLLQRSS